MMNSRHTSWTFGHWVATLSAAALAAFTGFACTLDSAIPTATPSPTASVQVASHTTIDIAGMVRDADAIVVGRVIEELEPTLVPRQPSDGSAPVAADRYGNFAIEIEESYVPGVEPSDIIVIRVEDGLQSLREGAATIRVSDSPEIVVDAELLLFLNQLGRYWQHRTGLEPPEGVSVDSYYGLPSQRRDENHEITVGYLVPQGGDFMYSLTGSLVGNDALEAALEQHASVVPPDCFGFGAPATDYIALPPVASLIERSDLVIKGRIGGMDFGFDFDTVTIEVLDVVAGGYEGSHITFNQAHWLYAPSFEPCEYYFFLRNTGGAFAEELGPYYDLAGGPQAVFVVHEGVVQQSRSSPATSHYRGMAEDEFVAEILESAEWAVGNGE